MVPAPNLMEGTLPLFRYLLTDKGSHIFRVGVFSLIPSGSLHVLRAHMGVHRARGEPNEAGFTPVGVELNTRIHGAYEAWSW